MSEVKDFCHEYSSFVDSVTSSASIALGIDFDNIIRQNVAKLKKRHPQGFSPAYMEKYKD